MKQKTVYILSGVPGCGKSKFAKSLNVGNSVIVSADNFFVDSTTGEYKFDIKQ